MLAGQLLEALLLRVIGRFLRSPVVATEDEIHPDKLFQLLVVQQVLQRQPLELIDVVPSGGHAHEKVVAQQVSLCEALSRVVEGFEDPVDVVVDVRGDLHDAQPRDDRLLHASKSTAESEPSSARAPRKNLYALPTRSSPPASGVLLDQRDPRLAVGLSRQQGVAVEPHGVLVEEVEVLDASGGLRVRRTRWSRMAQSRMLSVVSRCWPSTTSQL
jgi:hypothetical protein